MAKKGDSSFKSSPGKGEVCFSVFIFTHIKAFSAQDTPVGIKIETGVAPVATNRPQLLLKPFGLEADTQEFGHVLYNTAAVGRAIFTVNLVHRKE